MKVSLLMKAVKYTLSFFSKMTYTNFMNSFSYIFCIEKYKISQYNFVSTNNILPHYINFVELGVKIFFHRKKNERIVQNHIFEPLAEIKKSNIGRFFILQKELLEKI